MRRMLWGIAVLFASVLVGSSPGRRISVEDMARLRDVSEPEIERYLAWYGEYTKPGTSAAQTAAAAN